MHQVYRGDKSLARPGRKQAREHVTYALDFNIETQAVNFFFLQDKAPKQIHAILTETIACFLPGRAKDLPASCICLAAHMLYVHLYPGRRTSEGQHVNTILQRNLTLPPPPRLHSMTPF